MILQFHCWYLSKDYENIYQKNIKKEYEKSYMHSWAMEVAQSIGVYALHCKSPGLDSPYHYDTLRTATTGP